MTFKVGDKVRIVRGFKEDPVLSSEIGWSDEMSVYINDGNEYEVTAVFTLKSSFVEVDDQWYWPLSSLELVSDSVVEKQLSEILEDALMWRAWMVRRDRLFTPKSRSTQRIVDNIGRMVAEGKVSIKERPDKWIVPKNPEEADDSSSGISTRS